MSASSTPPGSAAPLSAFVERVRSGDLGSLPVIAGLVIIWTVFTSLNPVFLSADNLVNLLFDCSTVGVISLGIVCVLMVGQIDLSVGSMSGFASALVGMLWVNHGWPVLLAIVAAIVVGAVVGAIYALLLNRLGMPSFVATLAGLARDPRDAALRAGRDRVDQPALRLGDGEPRATHHHPRRRFVPPCAGAGWRDAGARAAHA